MKPFSTNATICNVYIVNLIYLKLQKMVSQLPYRQVCLTLADRIVAVERMVWHWGQFSLMKVFSFSNLSKISLEVQDSVLFVPTWRIKWRGSLSSIDTSLCWMSSIVAPGKLRTLTAPFFPDKCSSGITLIMELPAITALDYALILLSIFLAKEQLEIMRWFYCQLF